MSISVSSIGPISSQSISAEVPKPALSGGASFDKVFQGVREAVESKDILGVKLHAELQGIQGKLQAARAINPAELLSYQMKAQDFGLRVELISKVAESALSTVRKLQHNQ